MLGFGCVLWGVWILVSLVGVAVVNSVVVIPCICVQPFRCLVWLFELVVTI